jgi:hypothetical protein
MPRYEHVSFRFLNSNEEPHLIGEVLTRDGNAGPEMVLSITDPEGFRPYLLVGVMRRGKTYYVGQDSARDRGNHYVQASWAEIDDAIDDAFVGRWIEDGDDYLFSFKLPRS